MTQSGQGEEPQTPAARPAHEGVVLPADGGEPMVPGTYGDQAVPAGGTPWGQPWGPDMPQAGPSYGGQGEAFAQGQAWGPEQQPGTAPQPPQAPQAGGMPQPSHPQQPPAPQDHQAYAPQQLYGQQDPQQPYAQRDPQPYAPQDPQPYAQQDPQPYAQQPQAPGLPPQQAPGLAAQPPAPGLPPAAPQQPPGLPPQPQQQPPQGQGPEGALPPVQPLGALPAPSQSGAALPQSQSGGALPQSQRPQQAAPMPPVAQGGAPLPPAGPDAEATQYLASVPQAGPMPQGPQNPQMPQMPPYGAHSAQNDQSGQSGQSGQGGQGGQGGRNGQSAPNSHGSHGGSRGAPLPGALPPEAPAADATQFLGRQPQPPAAVGDPDVEATQYIAPVPPAPAAAPYGIRPGAPGDRQPPAEFDSLFRSEPAGGGADSTQQMPRFTPPPQQPGPGAAQPQYAGAPEPPARRRTGSKLPLFAAIGVAIAVLGVGVGALLASDGDEGEKGEPKNVADSAPASPKPSPTVDPAEEQAVALDKLLAESNDSRDAVIRSVDNIEVCRSLGKAATDLRGAAKQRNDLVTRLSQLEVDKLPNNAQLTTALNKAWKSSALADNRYAAWAGQVAGKGCHKGKARSTGQHKAAGDASREATKAKQEAASLWNAIAGKYGLTKRTPIQL